LGGRTYYKEKYRRLNSLVEIGLVVNADKTKYMVMSRDQNAGQSHNMKIENSTLESVEDVKYL